MLRSEWTGGLDFRPSPKVFGRQLVPFTMGHLALLVVIGCPLIDEAAVRQATEADVLLATWLCSMPHKQASGAMYQDADALKDQWVEWGRTYYAGNPTSEDFKAQLVAFRDYLAWHMRAPKRMSKPNPKGPAKKPVLRSPAFRFIISELLKSNQVANREEALDIEPAEAFALLATTAEAAGDDSLLTDRELIEIEEITARNRENS